jgi:chemotaxis protein histidine kinase CheA
MFKKGITEEQIIAGMRDDFLKDAAKRLSLLRENVALARTAKRECDAFAKFRAEVHTLKGTGQSFGFPSITMISRRLEGYLRGLDADSFAADTALDAYLEAIAGIIDAGQEPDEDSLDAILDGLAAPAN